MRSSLIQTLIFIIIVTLVWRYEVVFTELIGCFLGSTCKCIKGRV